MGLSRKLGQATGQQSRTSGVQTVGYQWSHQSYTIQEILRKFKLPCVVQCATDACTVMWSDFQFDLRQPLLLYSLKSVRKIHARSLHTVTLEEFGPPVAIPEDYEGWFAVSPKGVNKARRHTRVQGVLNANAASFLVCSKCPAFTFPKGLLNSLDFIPHNVAAGETLKRVCVMEADPNESSGPPPIVQRHGPCLECLDEKGEDVVIPLSHRVMLYEVSENFPADEDKAFNTKAIIAAGNNHLPRILSIVYGNPPALPYSYTGLYRCYSVFTEETILAATLDEPNSMCLELATDSCAKFTIGLNDVVIKKTVEYNNAFQVCRSAGEKYRSGIKVSFQLKPTYILDDMDSSMYENQSSEDVQEVDANSEFEIAWGSGGKSNINPGGKIKARNEMDKVLSESKSTNEQIKEDNQRSMNETTSRVDIEAPTNESAYSQRNVVDSRLQTELVNKSNPFEKLCSSCGEDVVKENPLFRSDSLQPEKESVLIQRDVVDEENDDEEEVSIISGDIIEVSIEETDYSSIIVKKANEYNEALLISDDDSDSETEELMMPSDKSNERYIVSIGEETCTSTSTCTGVSQTNGVISCDESHACRDNLEEPNEIGDSNLTSKTIVNSNQSISLYEVDCNATPRHCDINYLRTSDDSFTPPDNDALSHHTTNPCHEHQGEEITESKGESNCNVSDRHNVTVKESNEATQNYIEDKLLPGSVQNAEHQEYPNVQSSISKRGYESEKTTDLSLPFMDRLRKFRSGSNVNSCDLQIKPENRFHSSKVRHHPHIHPHKGSKKSINVFTASQDSLHPRGTTINVKESHTSGWPLIKEGKGASPAAIRSCETINGNNQLSVNISMEDNISKEDALRTNDTASGPRSVLQEAVNEKSRSNPTTNSSENMEMKMTIHPIFASDSESEEYA